MSADPVDAPSAPAAAGAGQGPLRLLQLAALTSTIDRFAIAPLLVVIGLELGAPLAAVAGVASVYYLAYGLMQPVWSVISDRIGRVRVMRIALLGATLGGVGSALAPDLTVLGLTRVVAGGCFAALIPATLVYVGDMWPADVRQRPLSDVLAASSLGVAAATAGAGVLGDLLGWRAVPALTAAAAAALWFALARLPEPERGPVTGSPLRSVSRVLGSRWGALVLGLAFVEGVVVLGVLTYLAPAVQGLGSTATVAGLVAASFGVGALGWSRLVRVLVGRVPPAGLAAIGGGFLVAAWAVPAVAVNLVTVTVAGLLMGGAWAFLHSTLQSWVTEVVPEERATAVALFAAMLFLGSAAGTAAAAPFAESGAFGAVFRVAAVAAVPVAVVAVLARRRYARAATALPPPADRRAGGRPLEAGSIATVRPAAEELPAGPLVLRRWRAEDADEACRIVVESLEHVAPWMPWATPGYSADDAVDFLRRSDETWGTDFNYAIVAPGEELAGSCSLMGRIGPGGFEIGYWVHPGHIRRGYGTAAAAALATEAFRIGADRVEIVHDVANVPSGAIPRRLGFTEVARRPSGEKQTPGEDGLDVVWRLRAPVR